jgi:tetratricopeptide (TPR) repeat protein
MRILTLAAAAAILVPGAALAVGREDARLSVEGALPPPPEVVEESPLDDLTALKRDVEAGEVAPAKVAAIMAEGNAAGRCADVVEVAEVALGTPTSVIAAAAAARAAATRAEERRTGKPADESAETAREYYPGFPSYQNDAQVRNEAGVAYYSLGRAADAHESYLAAISLAPAYGEPYANLGLLYRRKGWYEKALEQYAKALELRPTNEIVWYNRAVVLQRLGRVEEAVSSLETAIKLAPKYRAPVRRLALLWYDLGDYETAYALTQKLVYLAESDENATAEEIASANELLTLSQNRLGGKKAEAALTVEGTAATPPAP